jgi:cytochrome c oxidase subunit 2
VVVSVMVVGVALGVAACGGGTESSGPPVTGIAAEGQQLFRSNGCSGCHSVDGSDGAGPTLSGVAGSQVKLADGSTVTADDAYLRESIVNPTAKRVDGYSITMPKRELTDAQVDALIAYITALPPES